MTPLDDELRALLTARADALPVPADPLAGVEERAGRLRRRRLAGAVAGTALAAALVAVAVPAVLGGAAASTAPQYATTVAPTSSADPAALDPAALDPAAPWAFRGDASLAGPDQLRSVAAERQDAAPVVALYAHLDEPSGRAEVVYLAGTGGGARWGVALLAAPGGADGPRVLLEQPLEPGTTALLAALPGDEVPRLLVVAAPTTQSVLYRAGDAADFRPVDVPGTERGLGSVALEGDLARDAVRVVEAVGDGDRLVYDGPAPDPAPATGSSPPAVPPTRSASPPPSAGPSAGPPAPPGGTVTGSVLPANALSWPVRGTVVEGPPMDRVRAAYATALGRPDDAGLVQVRVLWAGALDAGVRALVGQAWLPGSPARSYGFATGTEAGEVVQVGPVTPAGTQVLALLLDGRPGSTTDELVVVPAPGTGQVLYDGGSGWEPAADLAGGDGVVTVARRPGAAGDALQLLDGDGRTAWEGAVAGLLCRPEGC